jgi:uncharacterized protein (DUF2236 family)
MQATCSIPTEQQIQPLGPESLTWRCFGDLRGLLLISRVGLLQNLHPSLAAGVQEHSDLFLNPWNRLFRSIPPILAVVYGGKQAIPAHGVFQRARGCSTRQIIAIRADLNGACPERCKAV